MDEVTITIDGQYAGTYYVSANLVKYISSDCYNTSSNTIYLYKEIGDHTEYIRLNPYALPIYVRSYNNSVVIHDITIVKFNGWGYFYRDYDLVVIFALFICVLKSLLGVFKHD